MQEISIGIFLISVVISRIFGEKAYRILTNEEKAKIMDAFSKMRAYSLVPLILIIGLFWLANKFVLLDRTLSLYGYLALLICYIVTLHYLVFRKLRRLEFKEGFIKKLLFSRLIVYIGIGILFFGILF